MAETIRESLTLFRFIARTQLQARNDGTTINCKALETVKEAPVSGLNPSKSTDTEMHLPPRRSAFTALVEVSPMDPLNRIFAADPTDKSLCDNEIRLYDALLSLPAPHGFPVRRYFADLLYFAGFQRFRRLNTP